MKLILTFQLGDIREERLYKSGEILFLIYRYNFIIHVFLCSSLEYSLKQYTYTHTHTYIHTFIHIHTYKHIHTYIHTYIYVQTYILHHN